MPYSLVKPKEVNLATDFEPESGGREDPLARSEKRKGKLLHGWKRLPDGYLSHRNLILFLSLLLTLIGAPIVAEFQLRGALIEPLLFLNLLAAGSGVSTPRERTRLLVIILLVALLRFLGRWLDVALASDVAVLLWVVLAVIAAAGALRFALRGREVNAEHLCAALSAYLLAGHIFGFVYSELEQLRPGSFSAAGAVVAPGQFELQTAIYFSFVTLATLGYGDISPLTPTARGLAVSEAILGQLYLAVLVARLVSGTGSRK
jgi:hypothetical protein